MFASPLNRRDFADTRVLEPLGVESALNFLQGRFSPADDGADAAEQFTQANAADSQLLRLVACAAGATLVLALVSSF